MGAPLDPRRRAVFSHAQDSSLHRCSLHDLQETVLLSIDHRVKARCTSQHRLVRALACRAVPVNTLSHCIECTPSSTSNSVIELTNIDFFDRVNLVLPLLDGTLLVLFWHRVSQLNNLSKLVLSDFFLNHLLSHLVKLVHIDISQAKSLTSCLNLA